MKEEQNNFKRGELAAAKHLVKIDDPIIMAGALSGLFNLVPINQGSYIEQENGR